MLLLCVVAMGDTGCLRHTRILEKPLPASVIISASTDQLVQQINERYDSIQSLSARVYIRASVGGEDRGKVTEYTPVRGFILLRKPDKLRVLGLLPVLETRAFDMASSGDHFTLWMPTKNKVVTGTSTVTKPSKNPLENLRPSVFLGSLLVRGVGPDEMIYVTNNTRVVRDPHSKHMMEEPDYDLGILRRKAASNELIPVRVIYISRTDMLPYRQDTYDASGSLITEATYSNYKDFGQTWFPMKITIKRPQDEYAIELTFQKLTFNLPLADDQFHLKVPRGTPVEHLK